MVVDEDYMNELLKYDFISTKKGRALSSILLHKKSKKQREPAYEEDAQSV
jgi:hypothetical protein